MLNSRRGIQTNASSTFKLHGFAIQDLTAQSAMQACWLTTKSFVRKLLICRVIHRYQDGLSQIIIRHRHPGRLTPIINAAVPSASIRVSGITLRISCQHSCSIQSGTPDRESRYLEQSFFYTLSPGRPRVKVIDGKPLMRSDRIRLAPMIDRSFNCSIAWFVIIPFLDLKPSALSISSTSFIQASGSIGSGSAPFF